MRQIRAAGVALLLSMLAVSAPGEAADAQTDCNPEQSKFVEYPVKAHGNKTAMFVFDRSIPISCGSVANTTHFALGDTVFDYIEGGTRQFAGSVGTFKVFASYNLYPSALFHYEEAGTGNSSQWVSFLISNTSGTAYTYRIQWGYGTVPASYQTIATTPLAQSNWGTPMSEISRYGGSVVDVRASMTSMKYRTGSGTWPYWGGLRCTVKYSQGIDDWDGRKTSDYSWETVYGPILAGGC